MSSSTNNKAGALIFLHGLGDTPAGWSMLETELPRIQSRLANIAYVFPPAPTIPISINGGMRMPGWFDLYDWPIGVGVQDDRVNKIKGIETIQNAIEKLHSQGIKKIVVGGFSQGGAIALLAAYHQDSKYANNNNNDDDVQIVGCAALSAWLTLTNEIKVPDNAKNIPLYWAHGQYDDKVLFEQQSYGINKLSEMGVTNIEHEQYPMGHSSHPKELVALANFVDKVIFGDDEESCNNNNTE